MADSRGRVPDGQDSGGAREALQQACAGWRIALDQLPDWPERPAHEAALRRLLDDADRPAAAGHSTGDDVPTLDLDAIRTDVENARYAQFHFDTDDLVGTDAVVAVIERHAPALLAEVERLRAQPVAGISVGRGDDGTVSIEWSHEGRTAHVMVDPRGAVDVYVELPEGEQERAYLLPSTQPAIPDDAPLRVVPEHFYEAAADAWNGVAVVYDLTVDQTDDRLRAAVTAVLRLAEADRPATPDDARARLAEAIRAAVWRDTAACRADEDDCFDHHPVHAAGIVDDQVILVYARVDGLAEALAPVVRAAVDSGREDLTRKVAELEAADTENRAIFAKYVRELHDALLDNETLTAERDAARTQLAEAEDAMYDYQHATERAEAERDVQRARLAAVRAEAEQWAAKAPADDWGDSMFDTAVADAGRVILRLLDTGKDSTG